MFCKKLDIEKLPRVFTKSTTKNRKSKRTAMACALYSQTVALLIAECDFFVAELLGGTINFAEVLLGGQPRAYFTYISLAKRTFVRYNSAYLERNRRRDDTNHEN